MDILPRPSISGHHSIPQNSAEEDDNGLDPDIAEIRRLEV